MEDRDRVVMRLYTGHYRTLVRLAALLVRDEPAAEKVVKASFGTLLDARTWERRSALCFRW